MHLSAYSLYMGSVRPKDMCTGVWLIHLWLLQYPYEDGQQQVALRWSHITFLTLPLPAAILFTVIEILTSTVCDFVTQPLDHSTNSCHTQLASTNIHNIYNLFIRHALAGMIFMACRSDSTWIQSCLQKKKKRLVFCSPPWFAACSSCPFQKNRIRSPPERRLLDHRNLAEIQCNRKTQLDRKYSYI